MTAPAQELDVRRFRTSSVEQGALLADAATRPRRWTIALAYTLSGVLLGLALTHPTLSICAWASVVCLAAALTWTESWIVALGGVFGVHLVGLLIGLNWLISMNDEIFSPDPLELCGYLVAQTIAWCGPMSLTAGLCFAALRRRVAVCWWLPVAWGAGEFVRFEVFTLNIGDWLYTQWTLTPVLRLLGRLGWWPTLFICLFAAACLGQAVAHRRRWLALPILAIVTAMLLLPPLPRTGEELLRGVAAVHTGSSLALPHAASVSDNPGDALRLVIWPETTFHLRPLMLEGGRGARLPRLLPDSDAVQILGVETRSPGRALQNQVVVVEDGRVQASRAKKFLLPVAERVFSGLGRDRYKPGSQPVYLEAASRSIIALICGELLSRALVAEGRRAGGELMVVIAGDVAFANDRAKRHLLAVQVMRSVEFGMPSVRASYGGWANFIASDGRVLALSGNTRNGLLRWDLEQGARDTDFRGEPITDEPASEAPPAEIAVLYSRDAPQFRTRCPEGRCRYLELEDFRCPKVPAKTVVVAGHGAPPSYLSHTPAELGAAIRCFAPELVVIDTCFGASGGLLKELDPLEAEVVAAPFMLPTQGLVYRPEFFSSPDPRTRALAVESSQGAALLRWKTDADELASAYARAAAMDGRALRESLVRRKPAQVGVALGEAGRVLIPFDWRRMQNAGGASGMVKRARSGADKPSR